LSPEEWERLLLDTTETVRDRVTALAARGDRGLKVGRGAAGDMTILADKQAEDALLEALRRVRGVRVLSEEAGLVGEKEAKTLAVVDPLDGSSNFERGIPFYCTSVAIVEGGTLDDVSVGVVRDLVTGSVYSAVKGKGARKDGKKTVTSRVRDPSEAVVGLDLSRGSSSLVSGLANLVSHVKRQVHFGANALELCYVSDGTVDAFVDLRGSIRITDFAAAYLIAKEAGATITGRDGGKLDAPFDLEHRSSFVASATPELHKGILELCEADGKK
jgi:myo-inositol-1(or 4)-monophosphatase